MIFKRFFSWLSLEIFQVKSWKRDEFQPYQEVILAGLGDGWDTQEMGQEGGAKGDAPVPNLGKEAT